VEVKKYLAATAALVVMAGVTACGGDDGGSGSGGSGKKNVTLIQGIANEPFYISMYCGAKEEAAAQGVDIEVTAPAQWDVAQQTQVVNSVAAKKPDAVLIAPVDKTAMAGPVKQLVSNGSKVIFVDTELTDPSVGRSRISSDNKLGGTLGAKALAKQVGDKGKVLLLSPAQGIATTDDRIVGAKEELKNHPGIQIIGEQYPGDDAAKAQQVVGATLAAHPDLAGIFAVNLVTGEGAATALKSANKVGAVKLIEFDASPKQVEDLKAGTIQALVSQQPSEIGRKGVQQAVAALGGKSTEKQIKTELIEVTKDNINDPSVSKYVYKSAC
jgi:ribose transport system substrate-binding protein